MPPKKKAKKTQTVSLDKRAQAKLLRGRASAFEAEATVEERIHELLEPAKVSANTYLLKVFHKKASAEVMLSHKKKAYLDAGFAMKDCEYEIISGEDAMELKGVGKSSASLIDKALEERKKVAKEFFNTAVNGRELGDNNNDFRHDVVDIKEALASLPEDTEIGLDESGTLYVNGCRREYFHAKGCPFKTEVDGVNYIVDGTGDYDAFSDACAGLEFSGTLTNVKEVFNFSFSYKHNGGNGAEEYEELEWKGDFEEDNIEGIAMEVVGNYEFAFCE